ncbi:MAG TPA: hypothetical protein VF671_08140 [Pseudomonas sp.]|jgi:hypothetical protein|uniref:hypothetical protein n=1 Tax=Pseudomonas sp. TaxID=306 RepID=UPI002EDABCDB
MPNPVGTLSRGPCCEINKLIVQVVGKDHPSTQRLAFYEKDASKRLDAVTAQYRPETVTAYMCAPSALHIWDWSGEPKHRLMLEVETTQGKPILLPLPETRITQRQLDQQWNQIVPVLPFVALPGVNSAHDHGTPVLCRAGFIYVFFDGRLWRELEVRICDERTTYHDIELEKFREGEGYSDEARLATGKALDDIWLPSNWNDRPVETQLCFSEVQLSGARLQRLESDSALRRQRCQSPDLRVSKERSKTAFANRPDGVAMLDAFSNFNVRDKDNQAAAGRAHITWLNLNRGAFPLSVPAPQRARQTGFEWMIDQPARYLCDLSGEFLANAFSAARKHVQLCEAGTAPYVPLPLEVGAWAQCLEHIVDPNTQGDAGLWTAQPPAPDVLQTARSRALYGVMLLDTQYRLRHLSTRIYDQRHLLELCAARTQRYPHHASALLVQQLIVPQSIGGKKNPLHQQLDMLKEKSRLDINRFTASSERAQLWRQQEMSQALLSECLQQRQTEQCLADHLSLDGFKYAAAFHFVSQLFVTLALGPSGYDPLAASGDISDALTGLSLYSPDASAGQQWIANVVNDPQHVMHRMLWPDAAQQDLDAPYQAPANPDINQGNGTFRATELANTEQDSLAPAGAYTTIDAMFLASLLKMGELKNTLTVTGKAGAGVLVAINENLQGALEAAERAVHGAQHIALQDPAAKRFRLSEAAHRRSLAQLRGMLPKAFGDLHFLSHADARRKDYYVFGLDDMPEKTGRSAQVYGVYRNQNGVMKSPAEDHGFARPQPVLPPERIVLGIPRNHRTALTVSRLNQGFNDAWQKDMAKRAADKAEKLSGLENAIKLRDSMRDSAAFRALDSVPVAGAIVGLEIYNLSNEFDGWEQTVREKEGLRGFVGVVGAGLDLAIAFEALTVKLAGSNSVLAAGRKTVFIIPDNIAKHLLGSLSNRLVKKYSARLLGQISAGLIFVGLNLYDAWYSYKWGDDAYIGHLIMASGGLIGTMSSLVIGGTSFLGLSPLGWASLLLIVAGAGVAYWLSSKPIEDWLKKGPFGDDPHNAAPHLQDPQNAFYYLVSLFADIRISIDRNPEYVADGLLDFRATVPFPVRSANTRIRIESNLSGLLNGPGELGTEAFLNLKSFEVFFDQYSDRSKTSSSQIAVTPVAYRLLPGALELFVKTPFSYKAEPAQNLPEVYHVWRVRSQLSLNDGQRTWVFPAPPPKDPTPFGPTYARPDFDATKRLFWADETENRAKAAK